MLRNKILWLSLSAPICLSLLIWLIANPLRDYIERSKDSEVIAVISAYTSAEENYFSIHHEFSAETQNLGISSLMPEIKVFFSTKDVPMEYLKVLPSGSNPYVEKDTYRLLFGVTKKDLGHTEFWLVDNQSAPRKLKEYVPFN